MIRFYQGFSNEKRFRAPFSLFPDRPTEKDGSRAFSSLAQAEILRGEGREKREQGEKRFHPFRQRRPGAAR